MKTILIMFVLAGITLSQTLPTGTSTLFSGSGNCQTCHTGSGTVLMENGVDISPVTLWRSSMMGNASKDPLWRAVVSEEVATFPELKETIESTCTRCHAPMGLTEAVYNGQTGYSMDELKNDPLANDGVSCTLCHQISDENMGEEGSYSGGYIINDIRTIYGPYLNPLTQPMNTNVNYLAAYSEHVNGSELCGTCHTLFTPFVDDNGQIAGTFPEQTPYLEWKNSIYEGEEKECQTCHMPITETPVDISSMPPWHSVTHSPFWKHEFTGGNVYMLNLLRSNIAGLGLTATESQFDSTLASAYRSLKGGIELSLSGGAEGGEIEIIAKIENNAGHKFPTGIPFRRMWLHITVEDENGNMVFNSGDYDEDGNLINQPEGSYQEHFNLIEDDNNTQIYEGIFGDVNNNRTFTLLRAATYLKDNRLPPKGFVSTHGDYEDIAIHGLALEDPDFNKDGETEGTGIDLVRYTVTPGYDGNFIVKGELLFQSVNPELVEHLETIETEDINSFLELYENNQNVPIILDSDSLETFTITNLEENITPGGYYLNQNYPNPFNPETTICFGMAEAGYAKIEVFDITGTLVAVPAEGNFLPGEHEVNFSAAELSSNIYFYRLSTSKFSVTKKMILLK